MRRDILYQYDLPIEVLDEIPETEEVLEICYARSDDKCLIPILFTRERIVWAYPEIPTVYHVYEMQYIDVVSIYVKYTVPASPSLQIRTVNKQSYNFNHFHDSKEEIRGRLIALCELLSEKVGGDWHVWHKKSLLIDEFYLDKIVHDKAANICGFSLANKTPSSPESDDIFEEEVSCLPGKGCYESNETLFSHFPEGGDDVFEEDSSDCSNRTKQREAEIAKVERLVHEVDAEILESQSVPNDGGQFGNHVVDDSVIYQSSSGKSDDSQWGTGKIEGDAMILADNLDVRKPMGFKKEIEEFSPKDDDSIVYDTPNTSRIVSDSLKNSEDDSIVYPSEKEESVVITPMKKPIPEFESIDRDFQASVEPGYKPVDVQLGNVSSRKQKPSFELDEDIETRSKISIEKMRPCLDNHTKENTSMNEDDKDSKSSVLKGSNSLSSM